MMKNDIEDLLKKSLDGHELPYQKGAWESFQKKMDAKTTNKSYKWWFAGAASVIAVLATFAFWENSNNNQSIASKSTKIKSKSELNNNNKQTSSENIESHNNTIENYNRNANSVNAQVIVPENSIINNESRVNDVSSVNNVQKAKVFENTTTKQETTKVSINKEDLSQVTQVNGSKEPTFPTFGNKCKGETIQIDNKGFYPIILKSPSGKENEIQVDVKEEIALKEIGVYQIGFYDPKLHGNFRESSNFKVFTSPGINLNIEDALTYENGLPTIKAEANTNEDNVLWKVENQGRNAYTLKPKSSELTFFLKGNYDVTVKVSNELGCESKDNKSVYIPEDYNLLAVNAFNPNSSDYRKNTFIPFALTVRNTPFRMVILDPDNGGVIYETSDASNAWDGIDRRDGKLVAANKAYIWKVSLQKPEPNEKSEYRGTIIRIP
jgi:hypothetical protein